MADYMDVKTVPIDVRIYEPKTLFLREVIGQAEFKNGDIIEFDINMNGSILVHVAGKPWMVINTAQYVRAYQQAVLEGEHGRNTTV